MEEKNDKIDLRKFFKTVFSHKLLFFIVLTLATGLGVYISFCIPKEYTTTVVLAPESSEVSGSDLSSLASMVGVRLGSSSNNDAFYPQIYPSLFDSNDFIIPLWKTNVETIDGKVKTNLYDYVLHHRTAPWWSIYIDKLSKKFLPKPVVGKKKGKNEV
ncbi:MAG: chain-length determining protein, partial [Prevotella sp.]|nr:chain-length determining protein [Prevotella sp.]